MNRNLTDAEGTAMLDLWNELGPWASAALQALATKSAVFSSAYCSFYHMYLTQSARLFAAFPPSSGLNPALVLQELQALGDATTDLLNAHALIAPVRGAAFLPPDLEFIFS